MGKCVPAHINWTTTEIHFWVIRIESKHSLHSNLNTIFIREINFTFASHWAWTVFPLIISFVHRNKDKCVFIFVFVHWVMLEEITWRFSSKHCLTPSAKGLFLLALPSGTQEGSVRARLTFASSRSVLLLQKLICLARLVKISDIKVVSSFQGNQDNKQWRI